MSFTYLVDDVQEPGHIFLELAAGIVVLRPHAFAVAVTPCPLLLTRTAQVQAAAGRKPVAGEVGPDPSKCPRPPGGNRARIAITFDAEDKA